MARNKEALVLLLDVGPSMHKVIPEVEKICSMLVGKKLIYGRTDEVGIVLFGTEDTDNDLEKQVGGYEHIVVLHGIRIVDEKLVETFQKLPRGTVPGDFLDAIVVGMDMLISKFGSTNKGKLRLCLITDAKCPIKDPFEGTKEDQVGILSEKLKSHGMKLDCIVTRGELSKSVNQNIMDENDRLLCQFSRKGNAKIKYVATPTSLLGSLRTRNISSVTIYRGDLEVSSKMKIKVWVYKKASEERFPTLKKYSDKAHQTDKFATHEVKVEFEYKSIEDPNSVVPPEQRIRGYRYGPQVIPVSSEEWEAVKFKPEKSVKLLGFTDASNVMRHHYLKDVNIFIPEPGNQKASVAVSSIARAMKEMNKVAILRCVWRHSQRSVVIGALTPNISSMDNMFPSFSSFPSSWQPNEQQQEVADNLVKMLDLAPTGNEILMPDLTPNPVLERFYRYLELKSKKPDAGVPPLDTSLKNITEPDPDLVFQSKSIGDDLRNLFELKDNTKKRPSKRLRGEAHSASNEVVDGLGNVASGILNAVSSSMKVDKIGDLTPVKDFEAMIARRDSTEWITKAIKEMQIYIYDLLENSYEGDAYPKAMECLVALRRGCILEQEPKEFNQFLYGLYERWKTTDLRNFFGIIASKNITLISKTEAVDSDVTDDEAKCFPVKIEIQPQ
uniref:ATP-dependent DNA helicase 2 subunit KU80 n=1 Tax=Anthurium amnicola TaxID=1678845 RepID=A0A1D1Z9U1_9ARAE